MSPARRLPALPHLGDTFTLDDAAARALVPDVCGWPVPAHREDLRLQLAELAREGHLTTDGAAYRMPPETLVQLADESIPDLPLLDIPDLTVDPAVALSRTAAALILLGHRLRRSLPQRTDGPLPHLNAATAHLLESPQFREQVATMSEPLDPVELLLAAARTAPHPGRAGSGEEAVRRILGPSAEPLRELLDAPSPTTDPDTAANLRALLADHDPQAHIAASDLSSAEIHLEPGFRIDTSALRAGQPITALGQCHLHLFHADRFEGSRAVSDPLLAEYEPQMIGGGLMATRRDATPLFRSLGLRVESTAPEPSLPTRISIARTFLELGDRLPHSERRLLAEAATRGTAVRIHYWSQTGKVTTRVVTDPTIVDTRLLRGYCHLRQAERTFRLDRIQQVAAEE